MQVKLFMSKGCKLASLEEQVNRWLENNHMVDVRKVDVSSASAHGGEHAPTELVIAVWYSTI